MKRYELKNIEDFDNKKLLNCFNGDDIILVQTGNPGDSTFINCFYLDKNNVLKISTTIRSNIDVIVNIPHYKHFKVFRINDIGPFLFSYNIHWYILGAGFDIKWFVYENETDFITDNFDILLKAKQLNIKNLSSIFRHIDSMVQVKKQFYFLKK